MRGEDGVGGPSASASSSGNERTFRGLPLPRLGVENAGADIDGAMVLATAARFGDILRNDAVVGSPFLGLPLFRGGDAIVSLAAGG